MFIKKKVEGLISDGTSTNIGTITFANSAGKYGRKGTKFGRVHGVVARNWASSAKAAAGADTSIKLKLTDGNSDVFYLEASARDWAGAEVTLAISLDDTATGLGVTNVDGTGAAATAGAGNVPVVQSPITVAVLGGGTATDWFECALLIEI